MRFTILIAFLAFFTISSPCQKKIDFSPITLQEQYTNTDKFKSPDNVYWLFSSSAQSIAAFIGFLAAGFFFANERLEEQVSRDETLKEINADLKKQYFRRIKILFTLTGLSIILSLVIVFLNGFDLGLFGFVLQAGVGLLNIITIWTAIDFVIYIINPNKVETTAAKLIKEIENKKAKPLNRGDFIEKYIKLENLLNRISMKDKIVPDSGLLNNRFTPVSIIIRELYQRELIDVQQYKNLNEVTKVRNLAAHGQIKNIDENIGSIVDSLILELETKFGI